VAKRKRAARRIESPQVGIRDSQAQKVYRWQWKWAEGNENAHLSKREVRRWLRFACKKLKLPMPNRLKIRFLKKGEKQSYYSCDQHELAFIPKHRNAIVVLHEIAHYITFRLYGCTVADHGPQFMRIWLCLLEQSRRWPSGVMYQSARAAGLQIEGSPPHP
jgi:hypothetical protein